METFTTITGNIATAPERRTTTNGAVVTSFRVAVGQRRLDKESGTWSDGPTSWYTVSAFRALGEHAYMSLHRGERVIVTGRLRIKDWENATKSGTSAEIEAEALGHDLLWGTSVFRKFERPAAGEKQDAWTPGSDTAEAGKDEDGWNAPGLEPIEPERAEGDEDAQRRLDELLPADDRELELVGAGESSPF